MVAFGAPSTLPRSTAIARPKSDTKDHENNDGGNFAHYIDASPPTLAGKNLKIESPFISPFGTMVPSSNNLGDSIFGSGQSTAKTSDKSEQASFLASTTPEGPPAHAAIPWPSPFATASPLIGKTFGGFVHKSTFGEEFGGGNRLTSFAAPGGDAKLGGMNGTLLPLGSKVHEDDDIEASDTEASGAEDKSRDGENDEADGRFQHQAGKSDYEALFHAMVNSMQLRLERMEKNLYSHHVPVSMRSRVVPGKRAGKGSLSSTSLKVLVLRKGLAASSCELTRHIACY